MANSDVTTVRDRLARYSAGDETAIGELIAAEYFNHVPSEGEPSATEGFVGLARDLKAAAPDLRIDIPDLAPHPGGLLRGTAVINGTMTGPLWGKEATGRPYAFELPVVLRPVDGRYAVNVELDTPHALPILRELQLVNPPDEMHLPSPDAASLPDLLLKVLFTGQVADKPCSHLGGVQVTRTEATACDDCQPDEIWPALRLCLTCGHVGCCDTAVNKHAKRHWEETGHPLIRSIRLDEGWAWCYPDSAMRQKWQVIRLEAAIGGGT